VVGDDGGDPFKDTSSGHEPDHQFATLFGLWQSSWP